MSSIYHIQMDNNKLQYLYYCMWRQKALVVLVLMLALWWWDKDGRRHRGRGAKYGPVVNRDVWRTSKLIRLIDTSERIDMYSSIEGVSSCVVQAMYSP